MDNKHDYTDTVRQAAEIDDDGARAERIERKRDAEFAYEALAVTTEMGLYGMESDIANLIQLQLAQELMYKFDPQSHDKPKK